VGERQWSDCFEDERSGFWGWVRGAHVIAEETEFRGKISGKDWGGGDIVNKT